MLVSSEILKNIRKSYNQHCAVQKEKPAKVKCCDTKFIEFKKKLEEGKAESFNNRDLVYYFREISGGTYYIANYAKDMAIFKRLRQTYSVEDIILMIDFLFSPANDYLDNPTVNLMASNWANTIHADAIAWADDSYTPHKKRGKRKEQIAKREYEKNDGEEEVVIGEWEDE